MDKLPKLDKADWGYAQLDPDPDFDAERNQRVIDNVIRKNELNFKRKERERKKALRERTSAIASYVKHTSKDVKISPQDYFGRQYLTELRGKQIIDVLKNAKAKQTAEKTNG